jgi:hypothetical protein
MKRNNYIFKEDERVVRESGKYCYYVAVAMIFLAICSIIIKISFEVPFTRYTLEIISLVVGVAIYLVDEKRKGILFLPKTDDCLLEMHYKTFRYIAIAMLFTFVLGDLVLGLINNDIMFFTSNIIIWGIPGSIFSEIAIKNGWLIYDKKKLNEINGKSELRRAISLAKKIFGIAVLWGAIVYLFKSNSGEINGMDDVIIVIKMSIFWGISMFVIMYASIRISEKISDKKVKEADGKDEE